MLPQNLTANEIRVIGCLMEKSVTTPEQYPLTLNALTNACNQKSSREPVMSLSQGTVQHTVRELLLRGPQTPGELRARSGRLHEFADNNAVVEALDALNELHSDPLVVQLPRTPGRKDSEYMHLLGGPVDVAAYAEQAESSQAAKPSARSSLAELEQRVSDLETQVAELQQLLE
jgi:uncharacterized protein YceH (UPF0502 family)